MKIITVATFMLVPAIFIWMVSFDGIGIGISLAVSLPGAFIIGACAYWAYGMMPLSMSLIKGNDAGKIVVQQGRGGAIVIPLNSIVCIEALPRERVRGHFNIRTYGSGGLFGWLGHFYNKGMGHYEMYATELKNLIIIKTVKKTYVFSCTERETFLQRVKILVNASNC